MSSTAAACGLNIKDLGFIYFDAHDDLDSPDVNENGYFDITGLSMLRGESWKTLMATVPGYHPFNCNRFPHIGLRDRSELQRQRVIDAGMGAIWGDPTRKVDFASELQEKLSKNSYSPALIHLDFDCFDDSYDKVNDFPSQEAYSNKI